MNIIAVSAILLTVREDDEVPLGDHARVRHDGDVGQVMGGHERLDDRSIVLVPALLPSNAETTSGNLSWPVSRPIVGSSDRSYAVLAVRAYGIRPLYVPGLAANPFPAETSRSAWCAAARAQILAQVRTPPR